jgi:hypothetical protein
MRKFIKIVESITDSDTLNHEIEEKLAHFQSEDRTKILDGMEIVHNAGATGVNIKSWSQNMRVIWAQMPKDELQRIFKLMTGTFGDLIHRGEDGVYRFAMPMVAAHQPHDHGEVDMTDPMAQLASAQIHYTGFAHQLMRTLGNFTPEEITHRLAAGTGMPEQIAGQFVDHCITMSAATVKPNGDGTYHWQEPVKKTGLSFLRDLEGYDPPAA